MAGLGGMAVSLHGLLEQPAPRRLPPTPEAAIRRAVSTGGTVHPPSDVVTPPSGPPLAVTLPTLGETAPVVSVSPAQGVLQPPPSPTVLAWSNQSSPAGASGGTTLIMGHINWAGQAGVFSQLADLTAGDPVRVEVGATWLSYRVVVTGEYLKGALPASVFATTGSPALALVTCGGTFDPATGHYDDNVVVMAVPLAPRHR